MSTPLAAELQRLIRLEGPIPLSRFMAEALGHPRHGYYINRDPLGTAGDFTTAPEISQMFGELVGLWCADVWQRIGAPAPLRLVEFGPGRGTLMADALRAAAVLPGFVEAVTIHLIETSLALRQRQQATLTGRALHWHATIDEVPTGPALVVANEFFDALPVRQFQRAEAGWHERLVAASGDGFAFTLGPDPLPPTALPPAFAAAAVGDIAELAPAREAVMQQLAERLVADGGAALVIDYGHAQSRPGDSLQAVRDHAFAPVLAAPGEADLTAHVDFQALAAVAAAAGAGVHGPCPQGRFLKRLGIDARAAGLKAKATARQRDDIDAAVARLTGAAEMGGLFKVLAVTGPDVPTPAGFACDGVEG